jgi:hypothetical protein
MNKCYIQIRKDRRRYSSKGKIEVGTVVKGNEEDVSSYWMTLGKGEDTAT